MCYSVVWSRLSSSSVKFSSLVESLNHHSQEESVDCIRIFNTVQVYTGHVIELARKSRDNVDARRAAYCVSRPGRMYAAPPMCLALEDQAKEFTQKYAKIFFNTEQSIYKVKRINLSVVYPTAASLHQLPLYTSIFENELNKAMAAVQVLGIQLDFRTNRNQNICWNNKQLMKNEAPIAAASVQYSLMFRAGKRGKEGRRVEKKERKGK